MVGRQRRQGCPTHGGRRHPPGRSPALRIVTSIFGGGRLCKTGKWVGGKAVYPDKTCQCLPFRFLDFRRKSTKQARRFRSGGCLRAEKSIVVSIRARARLSPEGLTRTRGLVRSCAGDGVRERRAVDLLVQQPIHNDRPSGREAENSTTKKGWLRS